MKRCFNLRKGIGRESKTISRRFAEEPMPIGPPKGRVCNLEPMLREHYLYRRWNVLLENIKRVVEKYR
ncbi:MAG: aldehyde ferredoxin oxidoreductase C-terminal domain-containing protein [Ignisphaera sp.]